MRQCIIGCGHTNFGRLDGLEPEDLIRAAVVDALTEAQIGPDEVDAIFLGTFNGGFVRQDFSASLVAMAVPRLRYKPAVRLENACATGSAALYAALDAIASRRVRIALVVGFEKMTGLRGHEVGEVLLKCSYVKEEGTTPGGFAGVFGRIAEEYFSRFGDKSDALARIAAKNHRNGVANPYAHLRKDLGFDFCRTPSEKNPVVAGPLKRSDCSPVSDGAAALVVAAEEVALTKPMAVRVRAYSQVNDYMPLSMRDPTRLDAGARAWRESLQKAGLKIQDLSLVETHDCFTVAELMEYEAMGLAEHGQGERVILDGITEKSGALPVNPSGGLKAKGHPIGATGVSMHALVAMQLAGAAGEMQIAGADLGGVFNMGGTGVANYVTVLEAVRATREC